MDHQGPGRTRSAADTRGHAPWQWLGSTDVPGNPAAAAAADTGPQPAAGYAGGTGTRPVLGRGSGAHAVLPAGTGAQTAGTGAQTAGTGAQTAGTGAQTAGTGAQTAGTGAQTAPADLSPLADFGYGLAGPGEDMAADDTDRVTRIGSPGLAAPASAAGSAGAAGRRRGTKAKPRRRLGSRTALLATAAVVVVAAAGFTGYKFLYEPRVNAPVPATLRLPTTAPGSPGFDQALGKWQHIGARTADPDPLTVAGLYPPQFVLNGRSYVRTAASVTKNCSGAVYGPDLQAALQSGHCSQVARASYVSGDGKMMGTVGVVNLGTSAAAQKAGQVTGPQEIIAPLTGKKGPTSKLGSGTGVVQAEIKGHYLILMWAEFTSLKSPSGSAQRQALEEFATNIVTGSANINLSTRMLSGKP